MIRSTIRPDRSMRKVSGMPRIPYASAVLESLSSTTG